MNILLTGGSGFVGQNLYNGLEKNYNVLAPSSKELNLLDYQSVESYINNNDISIVIHTAIRGGDKVLDTTLRVFAGLIRNIDKVDKIIHFGSGAEYAKTRDIVKINESKWGAFIPEDHYGLAKYIIHHIIQHEKKIVNLRLFGVYGKYEGYESKFISNAIAKNVCGLPITIKQNVVFDYLFINDLIPIVSHFIDNNHQHSAYNITPDESISLTNIIDIINQIAETPSKVHIVNEGLNFQYTGNNSLLRQEMPEIQFTSYHEGIAELYDYYRNLREKINRKILINDEYLKVAKINSYSIHL